MDDIYRVALVDPTRHWDELLAAGAIVWGINITDAGLAKRCERNLGPRRAGAGRSNSVIEAALTHELPPVGATLLTIKADVYALGTMAVLFMRRRRLARGASAAIPRNVRGRVMMIATHTKAVVDWILMDLPVIAPEARELVLEDDQDDLLFAVRMVGIWLESGTFPGAAEARSSLADDRSEQIDLVRKVSVWHGGRIATIETTSRFALSVGKRLAPVVIAINPEFRFHGGRPHRKVTIYQTAPGYVDLAAVADDLNAIEPGWGGGLPRTIGSPQGKPTTSSLGQLMDAVARHPLG